LKSFFLSWQFKLKIGGGGSSVGLKPLRQRREFSLSYLLLEQRLSIVTGWSFKVCALSSSCILDRLRPISPHANPKRYSPLLTESHIGGGQWRQNP